MSLSCSQTQNPGIAKSILSINTKKSNIDDLNGSLISGRKNLSNASVAELAMARNAEIKSVDFKSGIKNLNKAVDVLQMAESFLNHARCGLQEMKEIATNATGVMSDSTRESSLVPQFQDAVSRYDSGAQSYKYDCMPLLDGKFEHKFIVSSVYGQPSMETISLKNLDLTSVGLELAAKPTDVADIKTALDNLKKEFEAVNTKIGNETDLTAAKVKLLADVDSLMNKITALFIKIDTAAPETALTLGGAISDNHYDTINSLKTQFNTFKTDVEQTLGTWVMTAPSGAGEGEAIKTDAANRLAFLETMIAAEFKDVNTAFNYDTSQIVKVNTHENAMNAESVIDAALTKATNAITKVQGQQNALNKIACLSERNVLLQNKVADEYGSVDPIETNATISNNKLELERAVCALKENQGMQAAFSKYLSQCADYCA